MGKWGNGEMRWTCEVEVEVIQVEALTISSSYLPFSIIELDENQEILLKKRVEILQVAPLLSCSQSTHFLYNMCTVLIAPSEPGLYEQITMNYSISP